MRDLPSHESQGTQKTQSYGFQPVFLGQVQFTN